MVTDVIRTLIGDNSITYRKIYFMRKSSYYLPLILLVLLGNLALSQPTGQVPAGKLLLEIEKLDVLGSVLYIAAHPDDENTRLLSYLANERKVRTAYLSLTRGDGGQNLIGKEQGELLGMIRTQELLAARRVDGAEQFFTRAYDFGYSKKPEETLSFWNKDSIVGDVVWVIRQFRPNVIICRFPTTGEGGHGHHTASAIIAEEAFDAAGDPNKFTWQLQYTTPWQPNRLFWNTFNFGGTNTTSPDQLKIDVGIFNPLLGMSYGEIAADSRSNHKSQGFGSARTRGTVMEYFKQLKGDSAANDPLENCISSWKELSPEKNLSEQIKKCANDFNPRQPGNSVKQLIDIRDMLLAVPDDNSTVTYWKKQKLQQTEQLIMDCAGIWTEVYAGTAITSPGNSLDLTVQLVNRGDLLAELQSITYPDGKDSMLYKTFRNQETLSLNHPTAIVVKNDTDPYSDPYWLKESPDKGRFNLPDQKLTGKAENDAALIVNMRIVVAGCTMDIRRPVVHKSTDPVRGEVYRPLEILPPVTLDFSRQTAVTPNGKPTTINLTLRANAPNQRGRIEFETTEGWNITSITDTFFLANTGDEQKFSLTVTPGGPGRNGKIIAKAITSKGSYQQSLQRIEYDHIPVQFRLRPAEINVINVAIKETAGKIGYIEGAGDDVAACLEQIGYRVEVLNDNTLSSGNLNEYKAIVTGVRAYNTDNRMQNHYNRLMDYVKKGGNLIVQYNTNNRIGPVMAKIGPYPFTITRERVTEENAEVRFLLPDHPCLHSPNEITAKDFDDWIQERGIYFIGESDTMYVKPLSMNDSGEKPADGGLIIAPYGKGNFVYTGLAFFRELPAGVPGAYRLFSNLIELTDRP